MISIPDWTIGHEFDNEQPIVLQQSIVHSVRLHWIIRNLRRSINNIQQQPEAIQQPTMIRQKSNPVQNNNPSFISYKDLDSRQCLDGPTETPQE